MKHRTLYHARVVLVYLVLYTLSSSSYQVHDYATATIAVTHPASANLVLSRRPSGEHGNAATWVRASAVTSRSSVRRNPAQIDATLCVVGTNKLPLSTMFGL